MSVSGEQAPRWWSIHFLQRLRCESQNWGCVRIEGCSCGGFHSGNCMRRGGGVRRGAAGVGACSVPNRNGRLSSGAEQSDAGGLLPDLQRVNSWTQKVEEVDPLELLEVQLCNSTAPFILISVLFFVGLGMVSRLMPQLQIFFVGLPIQLSGGILLFGAVLSGLFAVFLQYYADTVFTYLIRP